MMITWHLVCLCMNVFMGVCAVCLSINVSILSQTNKHKHLYSLNFILNKE